MKKYLPLITVIFFVAAIASLLIYHTVSRYDTDGKYEYISYVPDFTLQNQFGNETSLEDFRGYYWIVNFIFTRCAGVCPVMTFQMARLHDSIPPEYPVRFVSISVDPERDTPDVLYLYAEDAGADHARWTFLTGYTEEIYTLSRQGFLLGVDAEGGTLKEPIMHSQRFVLVDPDGAIRGYYDGFDDADIDNLREDVITLSDSVR
jgi:protein SCO1